MVIQSQCEKWTHQFQWHLEWHGISFWVCSKCGEWQQQNEDLQGG